MNPVATFRCFFVVGLLFAFVTSTVFAQKHGAAMRIDVPPKIDGRLGEGVWKNAAPLTSFTQFSPDPGMQTRFSSDVRILYDDKALYIGAYLYQKDSKKSSAGVRQFITDRDVIGNNDYFAIQIDPYNNRQNAFVFGVTAAGVQVDSRITGSTEDLQWNAVWTSAVRVEKGGWCVEIAIPYSALRFPDAYHQQWNINFMRITGRDNEISHWSATDPTRDGLVQQFGTLDSVADIHSPLRLSFTPYLATYSRQLAASVSDRDVPTWDTKVSGGLDMKLGLGESFTLDFSLVPDFGQVQSDDLVLNLSPVEIRFDENRPFFTENADLFNRAGLLYTRRIGGRPIDYDKAAPFVAQDSNKTLLYNPDRSTILNTLKLSGRSKNGLGFGILNAIHGDTYADISRGRGLREQFRTEPLTNFNVVVVDQLLKNNSFISFVNTNVLRKGTYRDANVTGTEFRLCTPDKTYAFTGKLALSSIYSNDTINSVTRGYSYALGFAKISGNFRFDVGRTTESDTYNPNDLGYLALNNQIHTFGGIAYTEYTPSRGLNSFTASLRSQLTELYSLHAYNRLNVTGSLGATFRSFWQAGMTIDADMRPTDDYFEARITHHKFSRAPIYDAAFTLASDQRPPIAFNATLGYRTATDTIGYRATYLSIAPRFRVSRQFTFSPSVSFRNTQSEQGFADSLNHTEIFGTRNRRDIIANLTLNYYFTPRSSLAIRLRHYWSTVDYLHYQSLDATDGTLHRIPNPYSDAVKTTAPNHNYNAFNIDFVYRWQFAPGSELDFIWKNSVLDDNALLRAEDYARNLDNVLSVSHQNVVSVKFLYYLDYQRIKRKRKDAK